MNGIELATLIENRIKPDDIKSTNTMTITNKKGRKKTLQLVTKSKDNSKRQMIWFLSPPDDKGMSFLKIEHDDKDDLMKMWLPGFKKLRRIASSKKSDSFMGSDLSFEDLTNRNINDYSYKLISNESECEYKNTKTTCYELESIPKNINSQYSKHITWVIKENDTYLAIKENSFDKDGQLLKIKSIEFEKITYVIFNENPDSTIINSSKDFYIMNKLDVKNVQKNTSTSLVVNDISINFGIEDKDFNEMNLKRLP
ncbi:uncharacterized protein METZ01_LOCUS379308 [marine metagenome]|uniref:Uncharacterized protein TP-0789 domain-containing protein n=1 Tax=marine metagenome TaxID=408172 RepID=A0A382TWL0_9ZZZZ